MSKQNKIRVCRLCVTTCNSYKALYDSSGRGNEIYELAVKYIDSTILNTEIAKDLTDICLECWGTLCDFDIFKQSICAAQSKLFRSVKPDSAEPKDDNIKSVSHTNNGEFDADYMDIIEVSAETKQKTEKLEDFAGGNIRDTQENMYITIPKMEKPNVYNSDDKNNLSECQKDMEANTKRSNMSRKATDHCEKNENKNHKIITYKSRLAKEYDEYIARWRPHLRCEMCHESYSRFTLLREHFREKHPNVECHVKCCEEVLNRNHLIVDHIRLHKDPNAFQCKICGRRLLYKTSLSTHMSRKHMTHMTTLDHHSNRNHPLKCPHCGKLFVLESTKILHVRIHCKNRFQTAANDHLS